MGDNRDNSSADCFFIFTACLGHNKSNPKTDFCILRIKTLFIMHKS